MDSLSLLTSHNVHEAITSSEAAFTSPTRYSPLELANTTDKPLPEPERSSNIESVPDYSQSAFQPIDSVIQESPKGLVGNNATQSSSGYVPHLPVMYATSYMTDLLKGGSLFKFLKHRKKKDDFLREMEPSLPPQTPPKDNGHFRIHPMFVTRSDTRPSGTNKILRHQRSRSMSDFGVVSHARSSEDMIAVQPENHDSHLQDNVQLAPLPLGGKWAHKGTITADPVERAHRRRELELQKEREEQELVKEEAERQRRLKLEKEIFLQQEKEEEARRLAEVEQEISRIRLERRRREQSEKAEEERQRRELEDRKRLDRKRRLEEHQRLEEWRKQQAQKLEDAARQADEIQRREEARRKHKIQLAEAVVKQTKGEKEPTGWITIQSRDAVSWRRRHFKFVGTTMILHRSAEVKRSQLVSWSRR